MALSGISTILGPLIVYLLGSLIKWRQVALIPLIIPFGTMLAVYFVSDKDVFI